MGFPSNNNYNNSLATTSSLRRSRSSVNSNSNGRRYVQSRAKDDVIERFFDWSESAFCPADPNMILGEESKTKDPDVLDYVFDKVESFTCAPEDMNSGGRRSKSAHLKRQCNAAGEMITDNFNNMTSECNSCSSLRRDNSLVEEGPDGNARQLVVYKGKGKDNKGFVDPGDMLDYCFEKVESFVCTEGNEALLLGQAAPPNKILDGNREMRRMGSDCGSLAKKQQLRRAKAAIEAQINAMDVQEKQQQKQKKEKKRKSFFSSFSKKNNNSSSATGVRNSFSKGTSNTIRSTGVSRSSFSKGSDSKRDYSIPTDISITRKIPTTPTQTQTYLGRSGRMANDPPATALPAPVTPPSGDNMMQCEPENVQLYHRPMMNAPRNYSQSQTNM